MVLISNIRKRVLVLLIKLQAVVSFSLLNIEKTFTFNSLFFQVNIQNVVKDNRHLVIVTPSQCICVLEPNLQL